MSKFITFFRPLIISKLSFILLKLNKQNLKKLFYQKNLLKYFAINLTSLPAFLQQTDFLKNINGKYKTSYEVEKDISDMVIEAEKLIGRNKMADAKIILKKAIELADENHVYSNISAVYELLSNLAYREGGITEAEDMLADFIEKLLQLGYPEDHNSIIRFKIKLARLYQVVGNLDLAELGYRDCIHAQEQKMTKDGTLDDLSNILYANSLFWYGKLLSEKKEHTKAKTYLRKCLKRIEDCNTISTSQKMVVYYYNAENAIALNELDNALNYLYDAIDIGTTYDISNPDLPLYVVRVGLIFMKKGLLNNAVYWCKNAEVLAAGNNTEALKEAQSCLEQLEILQNSKKAKKL